MKKQKQQKNTKEVKMVNSTFYFYNQGKLHTLTVTAPENVPKYRLKELFDQNFVGKKEKVNFDPTIFNQYQGTYVVS